jgi:hypothetical protein
MEAKAFPLLEEQLLAVHYGEPTADDPTMLLAW